jgi:GNAT superfamily N-acetyltransferase
MVLWSTRIGLPGWTVPIPCAAHAGLRFRQVVPPDARAILAHFSGLAPEDRHLRFWAALGEAGLERHVAGLWTRPGLAIAAWGGPNRGGRPILALAELAVAGVEAELGLSVDRALQNRGIGSYLVRTAARLLALRGVQRLRAQALHGNTGFLRLALRLGAEIAAGPEAIEFTFDISSLHRSFLEDAGRSGCWS